MLARRLDIEHPRAFVVVNRTHADIDFHADLPISRRGIVREDARPTNSLPLRSTGFGLCFGKAEGEFPALLVADVLDVEDFDFHLGLLPVAGAPCTRTTGRYNMHYVSKVKKKNPAPLREPDGAGSTPSRLAAAMSLPNDEEEATKTPRRSQDLFFFEGPRPSGAG